MKNYFKNLISITVALVLLSVIYPLSAKAESETLKIYPNWNLVTVPFKFSKTNVNNVIGANLPENSMIYRFNYKLQDYSDIAIIKDNRWVDYYDNSKSSKLAFAPYESYWIYNSSKIATFDITLYGTAVKEGSPKIMAKDGEIQFLGTTYKSPKSLYDLKLNVTGGDSPENAGVVYIWNQSTQWFDSSWFCGNSVCKTWGADYYNQWLKNDYSKSNLTVSPFQGFIYAAPYASQVIESKTPAL